MADRFLCRSWSRAGVLAFPQAATRLPVQYAFDGDAFRQPDLIARGVDTSESYYKSNFATQVLLLRSPLVIDQAVKDHDLSQLKTLAGSGNPTSAIIARLNATPSDEKAEMLDLVYRCADPGDCQKVLNAVADSYQKFLGETQQSVSQETVELITEGERHAPDAPANEGNRIS